MSELSDIIGIVGTLAGIIVGFMLSGLADWSKNRKRQIVIKKALSHELTIIKDTLEKAKSKTIPAQQTPFITETYDAVKVELASFLEPMSLTTVQRTYEMIRRLNQPVASIPEGYAITNIDSDRYYFHADFSLIVTYIYQALTELR